MDRRLLAICLCLALLAPTSASPASLSMKRLRGGAPSATSSSLEEVMLGSSEDAEDPNEPYIRESSVTASDGLLSSGEGNGRIYNAAWSAAREELTEIIREREAVASASGGLRLRGGSAAPAQGKAGMVPVTIKVSAHHIHPINSPPVKVVICGEGPQLGNWDVTKGVELKSVHVDTESFTASGAGAFPEHTGTIMLPAGTTVEYKFAVTLVDPATDHPVKTQWEAVQRKLTVPASGSLEIRSEFMEARDSDPRITDEPFQCNAQEWSRWYRHHTSGLAEVQPGREG